MSSEVKPLPSTWISHIPSKDRTEIQDFSMAVRASTMMRDRLISILEQKLDSLDGEEASPEFYGNPEISHRMAYFSGRRHVIREILKLLDF